MPHMHQHSEIIFHCKILNQHTQQQFMMKKKTPQSLILKYDTIVFTSNQHIQFTMEAAPTCTLIGHFLPVIDTGRELGPFIATVNK